MKHLKLKPLADKKVRTKRCGKLMKIQNLFHYSNNKNLLHFNITNHIIVVDGNMVLNLQWLVQVQLLCSPKVQCALNTEWGLALQITKLLRWQCRTLNRQVFDDILNFVRTSCIRIVTRIKSKVCSR